MDIFSPNNCIELAQPCAGLFVWGIRTEPVEVLFMVRQAITRISFALYLSALPFSRKMRPRQKTERT